MKKIRIEFQDENSTEFKVDVRSALTYRELLVLARGLPDYFDKDHFCESGTPTIEIELPGLDCYGFNAHLGGSVAHWQIQLVADEFYLAAQHIFFTQQNQAMVQAARNQQAISALQRGGNSGLIIPGGRG